MRPHSLIDHLSFLRRLAADLVADEHAAEDLVQQTVAYALARPPRRSEAMRAWLRKVMRHLAINRAHKERHRRYREQQVAMNEAVAARQSTTERLEVHRALSEAVRKLPEPYQSTIVERYLVGRTPRAIAELHGIAVDTVKTRLKRGLRMLREDMKRRFDGDPRVWSLAFLGVPKKESVAPLVSAASVAVLAAGAAGVWLIGSGAPPDRAVRFAATVTTAESSRAPSTDPLRERFVFDAPALSETLLGSRASSAPVGEIKGSYSVDVRVLDERQLPVDGVEVVFSGDVRTSMPPPVAFTAADGRARLDVRGSGFFVVRSPEWETALAGQALGYAPDEDVLILVGHPRAAQGRVVDEQGRPIPDVQIGVVSTPRLRKRLGSTLHRSTPGMLPRSSWCTDERGLFELARVPDFEGTVVEFRKLGFSRTVLPADGLAEEIVLRRSVEAPDAAQATGRVVDSDGLPVAGAFVSAGTELWRTDPEGRFSLPLDGFGKRSPNELLLQVAARGYEPIKKRLDWTRLADPQGMAELWLERSRDLRALRGRVLDTAGNPLPGAEVWLQDPTWFSMRGSYGLDLETVLAGAESAPDALERRGTHSVRTDAAGRFEIQGLDERDYRVMACAPGSGVAGVAGPFRSGASGVNITLDSARVLESFHGRVVDPEGVPVTSGLVWLLRERQSMRRPGALPEARRVRWLDRVPLGPDGTFHFEDVPLDHIYLSVTGEGLATLDFALVESESQPTAEGFGRTIRVPRLVTLEIDSSNFDDALSVSVLVDGRPVPLDQRRAPLPTRVFRRTERFVAADQATLMIPETATEVVVFRQGVEALRIAIQPRFGDALRIQL